MHRVVLPRIGTGEAWRDAARGCLASGHRPEQILWAMEGGADDLFGAGSAPAPRGTSASKQFTVPRGFLDLAQSVVWHSDPERFARLYALLWRLQDNPRLLADRGDAAVAQLRQMQKAVHRCQHKMKAFVRFREIGDPSAKRRTFAAWFEPTHHTVEPTAGFFQRRFSEMDWHIITPDVSASCVDGKLSFAVELPTPDLPEDASEALWTTYFCNIFNPARLKVKAMQSEMPKKYWANMPEARAIPELISSAPERMRAMAEAAPTAPSLRAERIKQAVDHPPEETGLAGCTRCPLHLNATQAVPGEGPADASVMVVGEQPGDAEDLAGRPFVGPAGQLFDRIAGEAGFDRTTAYVTNAVKHFKFVARGKRRIHQRPISGEVQRCRWWLDQEIALVKPKLIVAMGATAAEALTGDGAGITRRRGCIEEGLHGVPVLITVHPSYILRLQDGVARVEAHTALRSDLSRAVTLGHELEEQAARGQSTGIV